MCGRIHGQTQTVLYAFISCICAKMHNKAYYNEDRFSHDSTCGMKPSQIWKKKKGRQYMEE
jgi:hypothetical protein